MNSRYMSSWPNSSNNNSNSNILLLAFRQVRAPWVLQAQWEIWKGTLVLANCGI